MSLPCIGMVVLGKRGHGETVMRVFGDWDRIGYAVIVMIGAMLGESRAEDRQVPQPDSPLQKLYQEDARRWDMWVDSDQKRKAEIIAEPVFRWQNLSRANGQSGAMFVWIFEGRPVVIGVVFSNPENNRRIIM